MATLWRNGRDVPFWCPTQIRVQTVLWHSRNQMWGKPRSVFSMVETGHPGWPVMKLSPQMENLSLPLPHIPLMFLFYHSLDHKWDSKLEPMERDHGMRNLALCLGRRQRKESKVIRKTEANKYEVNSLFCSAECRRPSFKLCVTQTGTSSFLFLLKASEGLRLHHFYLYLQPQPSLQN